MQALWSPSADQVENSNINRFMQATNSHFGLSLNSYSALHRWSVEQPLQFWPFLWDHLAIIGDKGDRVATDIDQLEKVQWFPHASLNFAENLLRRHDHSAAITFQVEDQPRRELSWAHLHQQVSQCQQYLRACGVQAGDRVAACMPNCPETVVAMLATTSLGGVWTSTSPDFGADSIIERFSQVKPKVLIAVDGYRYNGKAQDIRHKLSEINEALPSVDHCVIFSMLGLENNVGDDWQVCLDTYQPKPVEYRRGGFNDPLCILYSSGTTGKPKCIVHRTGGILLQHLKEHKLHCDVQPEDTVFWFTTCGWMMWNWLVSGLAAEATIALYDGSPMYPSSEVLFDYCDEVGITLFGTSAKFIDSLKKANCTPCETHDLSSVRTIGSTGSVLAPESFDYVYGSIKADVCLSSVSGGTDICGSFIGGNPMLPVYKGQLQCKLLGMDVAVFDDSGNALNDEQGELVCCSAHVSMPWGFWDDPTGERYHAAYFDRFDNVWCHGDYVEVTKQGGVIVYGRSDATLNPGGVRIGTAEIYRHVEQLDEVIEAVAIGQNWDADVRVVLFVVLQENLILDDDLTQKIRLTVRLQCTPRHVPAKVLQVAEIPRTRSGKIVELAIKEVVHQRPVKNLNALANPEALEHFKQRSELAS